MAAAASSTSSCSGNFFSLRPANVGPRVVRGHGGGSAAAGCGKLDGVAMWFINGVATAFFASLERCSCIRIATEDDVGEEANDVVPLIHCDGNVKGTTSRRKNRKGKIKGGGGSGRAFLQD